MGHAKQQSAYNLRANLERAKEEIRHYRTRLISLGEYWLFKDEIEEWQDASAIATDETGAEFFTKAHRLIQRIENHLKECRNK